VHAGAKLDVAQHRHAPEQGDILKGTGQPQGGPGRWPDALEHLAAIADGALLGFIEAGNAVEHGGLARRSSW